jgi:hypothetical protein
MKHLIFILAMGLSGCGLFGTREPENPINAGSQFEPATTPSLVLRNIESALGSANAADYRRCFSDTMRGLPPFVFQPSVQGNAVAPTLFGNWGAAQEQEYFENIIAELLPGQLASVTFTPSDVLSVPVGDSVGYLGSYRVRFPHSREGVYREAEGSLQLTLRLSRQNEWHITYWRDISNSGNPSWSEIKARFVER